MEPTFVIQVEPKDFVLVYVAKDFDSLCLILQHYLAMNIRSILVILLMAVHHIYIREKWWRQQDTPDTHYLFRSPSLLHPLIRWTAFPCLLIAYIGQF